MAHFGNKVWLKQPVISLVSSKQCAKAPCSDVDSLFTCSEMLNWKKFQYGPSSPSFVFSVFCIVAAYNGYQVNSMYRKSKTNCISAKLLILIIMLLYLVLYIWMPQNVHKNTLPHRFRCLDFRPLYWVLFATNPWLLECLLVAVGKLAGLARSCHCKMAESWMIASL